MKQFLNATVKSVDDAGSGSWTAVASTPSLDRDGEVIVRGAFNPLPPLVPIHADHDMSTRGVVGSGRVYYVGDELRVDGKFASTPFAQTLRQLVKEGHVATMSVGFMGTKRDPDDRRRILAAELLEVSWVTVPSNRDARVLAAKSAGAVTVYEARRLCTQTLLELAELDLKQLRRQDLAEARALLQRGRH